MVKVFLHGTTCDVNGTLAKEWEMVQNVVPEWFDGTKPLYAWCDDDGNSVYSGSPIDPAEAVRLIEATID